MIADNWKLVVNNNKSIINSAINSATTTKTSQQFIQQIPCSKSRFDDLANGKVNEEEGLVNETQNALLCPLSSGLSHLLGIAEASFSENKVDDNDDDDVFGNKQESKHDRQRFADFLLNFHNYNLNNY